jgi:hypothetical protein
MREGESGMWVEEYGTVFSRPTEAHSMTGQGSAALDCRGISERICRADAQAEYRVAYALVAAVIARVRW